MSDLSDYIQTEEEDDVQTRTSPTGVVVLQIGGLQYNDSLKCGDIVITREPTEVPVDKVKDVYAAAKAADMKLEVVQ